MHIFFWKKLSKFVVEQFERIFSFIFKVIELPWVVSPKRNPQLSKLTTLLKELLNIFVS